MQKRAIEIFDFFSDSHDWTVAACDLGPPEVKTNLVDVPGGLAPLDLSDVLTDGRPQYGTRTLTVRLEISENTRARRGTWLRQLVHAVHGRRGKIILPDYVETGSYYLVGRASVKILYHNLAHSAAEVTAVCDPWLYAAEETVDTVEATATEQTNTLVVSGYMPVCPTVTVTGGPINLTYGANSWALSEGVYELPDLLLDHGNNKVQYSGSGTLSFTWREGRLE